MVHKCRTLLIVVFLCIVTLGLFGKSKAAAPDLMSRLWEENQEGYRQILEMPFNRDLCNGQLDPRIFQNYIVQDYLYLQTFRKAYGILLSKAPNEKAASVIVGIVNAVDEEIRNIHSSFTLKMDISRKDLLNAMPAPYTEFYAAWLIKTATIEPFEVGFIATLPCHWIYARLGIDMRDRQSGKENPYREWIDGYAEDSWETSETKKIVDYVGELMAAATPETREKMRRTFAMGMCLEYLFWNGAYKGATWCDHMPQAWQPGPTKGKQ
jgi:thiaminase (transcriptional activator TenA)